jgi:hypothetical protein
LTASSKWIPRSTIIPTSDSNCSFTVARSAQDLFAAGPFAGAAN